MSHTRLQNRKHVSAFGRRRLFLLMNIAAILSRKVASKAGTLLDSCHRVVSLTLESDPYLVLVIAPENESFA